MQLSNNRESQRGSIQKRLKLRTAVAAAAVKVSTDTEMGLVDVCTILSGNSERAARKPVAVAEGREGGPVTLDLTNGDFNKTKCRTRWRKLIENSKPLLLMGSPIDSDGEDD